MDSSTEANLARRAPDERHTVRVQALVDRSSARLGTGKRHTTGLRSHLLALLALVTGAEPADDRRLHRELDPVERDEPDDVPDPDNTDPAAGDGVNIREAPVGVCSDDGGDDLGDDERTHECERRTLHEEESVRTSDEDERLGNDSDLEVRNHVQLRVVAVHARASGGRQRDAELVLEEGGLNDNNNEDNAANRKKQSHESAQTIPNQ